MTTIIAASSFFSKPVMIALISGGIVAGLPLMLVAVGETISERAGVLNLGLEGMMLMGAYMGFLGTFYAHSPWVGFLLGAVGGLLAGFVMMALCVWMRLDQIVVGIAITLAGEGITSVLQGAQFGTTFPRLGGMSTVSIPVLSKIPVIGPGAFNQQLLVYLSVLFVILLGWVYRSTNIGLNLHAAGEQPEALDAAGVSVMATRAWATLATSALAGIGGAFLAIVGAGVFTPMMTNGEGYMGIVICMLARLKPSWTMLAALLFGIAESMTTTLQVAGVNISTEFVNMLPFVAIMVALILFGRRAYLSSVLALPYFRGARG